MTAKAADARYRLRARVRSGSWGVVKALADEGLVEHLPRRVTLVTLRGHPLAGAVRFLFEPRGERVRVEVQVYDRPSNAADWLMMRTLGSRIQDLNWEAIVERMVEESGGEAPEGVEEESATLDDDQAREVERWLAELVRERKRRERQQAHSPEAEQHRSRPDPTPNGDAG